jgi:DNA-binding Xre family transcriptional regulator
MRRCRVAKVLSHIRRLRRELAAKENRDVTVQEMAERTGMTRTRMTNLELGKFDRVANDEITALCTVYTASLGRAIGIADLFEYDPNNKRAFGQEAAIPA